MADDVKATVLPFGATLPNELRAWADGFTKGLPASPIMQKREAMLREAADALELAQQPEEDAPAEDFKPAFMRWAQSLPVNETAPISVAFKAGWEARERRAKQSLCPQCGASDTVPGYNACGTCHRPISANPSATVQALRPVYDEDIHQCATCGGMIAPGNAFLFSVKAYCSDKCSRTVQSLCAACGHAPHKGTCFYTQTQADPPCHCEHSAEQALRPVYAEQPKEIFRMLNDVKDQQAWEPTHISDEMVERAVLHFENYVPDAGERDSREIIREIIGTALNGYEHRLA